MDFYDPGPHAHCSGPPLTGLNPSVGDLAASRPAGSSRPPSAASRLEHRDRLLERRCFVSSVWRGHLRNMPALVRVRDLSNVARAAGSAFEGGGELGRYFDDSRLGVELTGPEFISSGHRRRCHGARR